MGIADNQTNTSEAPGHKIGKKATPMGFSFAQLARQTKNLPFTGFIDPDRPENGYVFDAATMANLFVTGVQIHYRVFTQRPRKEGGDFLVQSLRKPRNLRRGNRNHRDIL